jgi:hypothetical protein
MALLFAPFRCPRCGVRVRHSVNKDWARIQLVGPFVRLWGFLFAPFICDTNGAAPVSVVTLPAPGTCGEVARSEFSPGDRARMRAESISVIAGIVGLFVAADRLGLLD